MDVYWPRPDFPGPSTGNPSIGLDHAQIAEGLWRVPPTASQPLDACELAGGKWSGMGLVLGSLLVAWLVMSLIQELPLFSRARPSYTPSVQKITPTFNQRKSLAAESNQVAAITLSGGGYRAALTHAGLLWMLDQARVPIHMLSTVSGGSIIGTAYAAGWSPEDCKNDLQAASPGLTNNLLRLFAVVPQLVNPHRGSGDIYERHFDRIYCRVGRGEISRSMSPLLIVLNRTCW
jgi:hypothetical protein